MRKPAKILLLALIVALLPLRSMAALMSESCGFAQEQIESVQSAADARDSQASSTSGGTHCPAAAFLAAAAPASLVARADERGLALVQPGGPAFFPDNLDRPPLAPLR